MADENILHYGAIRLRVNGLGNLIPTFKSLDKVDTQTLVAMPMSTLTAREPLRLSNFITQRATLRLETTEINEIMRINRIVIFIRPIWTEFPG